MAIRSTFSLPVPGRWTKVLLAFTLAVVALFVLSDWGWLRRPLELYLIHRSGREVRIDDLHVKLGFTLEPTIRLRGVYIENAPWAGKQPFATAGEASFTLLLQSLWRDRPVISRLVLVDARIDMERQADGLRNWRLTNPDDRSPGEVRVLTLEAHRTQIHFVNRAIDLDLVATAAPLETESARSDEGLSTQILFEGSYQGHGFSGEALSGRVLSFRESGLTFPLRGHIVSRSTRLEVDGFVTDLYDLGPMDVKVRIAGPTVSQLYPFLRIRPPDSRPYIVEAQLTQTHDVFHFAQLKGRIGGTSLTGDVIYDRSAERPLLKVALNSDAADFDDLRPLLGMQTAGRRARSSTEGTSPRRELRDTGPTNEPLFPKTAFRADALRAFDARVAATATKLAIAEFPMLEDVRLDADLSDGLLAVKSIDVRVAGGRVTGSVTLDARKEAPSALVSGEVRRIRIERLIPALSGKQRGAGAVSGRIKLSGRGNSIADMVRNSTGSFEAKLDEGRISNLADAKLARNFGKVASVFLRGDRDIAINCGALAFDVRDGIAKSRKIVLDTEQTHIEGVATVNLRDEQLDVVLTPEPKKPGLFVRRASIRLRGPLRAPALSIEDRVEQAAHTAQERC